MQREKHIKWAHTRLTATHAARLAELGQATGLSQSKLLRALIENARVEPHAAPASVLPMQEHAAMSSLATIAGD